MATIRFLNTNEFHDTFATKANKLRQGNICLSPFTEKAAGIWRNDTWDVQGLVYQ